MEAAAHIGLFHTAERPDTAAAAGMSAVVVGDAVEGHDAAVEQSCAEGTVPDTAAVGHHSVVAGAGEEDGAVVMEAEFAVAAACPMGSALEPDSAAVAVAVVVAGLVVGVEAEAAVG